MAKRRQVIEIFAPVKGLAYNVPTTIMDPRSQPYGLNFRTNNGMNQKYFGTSLYATSTAAVLGAPINHIFEAQFPAGNHVQVFTATGVYKYTSTGDTFVSDGQTFTGTYEDYWTGVMHNDTFIYNNGIDKMQYKASYAATGTDMASAVTPTTYKCWGLMSLNDHLNMYHVIENGTEYAKRVQWSKKGVLVYSAGTTDFASGTYGAIDLQDVEGEIQCAVPLGTGAAIYADRSIHIQYWVGETEVYRFQKTISGVGALSRRGVVSFGDVNYFISSSNIWAYYGGSDLRPMGDSIKKRLFTMLNPAAAANTYLEYDESENSLNVHIPTYTGTYPDYVFTYNFDDESWSERAIPYTATGRYTRRTGLTIGELVGNIGAQTWKFGDVSVAEVAPVRLYGDVTGVVSQADKTRYSIVSSGTSIPQTFIYETPDLTAANLVDPNDKEKVDYTFYDKVWRTVNIELKGNGNASVLYSTDKGTTFVELPQSPIAMIAAGTTHTLAIPARSQSIRFRITNTGTNEFIGLTYAKVEFIPGREVS